MSDEIIKVLDNLAERFGIAIDWTSQNVMPYLQDLMNRYVSYEMGMSIMWIVILGIILIVSLVVLVKCIKRFVEEDQKDYIQDVFRWGYCMIGMVIAGVLILISVIELPNNIETIIKAKTVPEILVYDYVKTLK